MLRFFLYMCICCTYKRRISWRKLECMCKKSGCVTKSVKPSFILKVGQTLSMQTLWNYSSLSWFISQLFTLWTCILSFLTLHFFRESSRTHVLFSSLVSQTYKKGFLLRLKWKRPENGRVSVSLNETNRRWKQLLVKVFRFSPFLWFRTRYNFFIPSRKLLIFYTLSAGSIFRFNLVSKKIAIFELHFE